MKDWSVPPPACRCWVALVEMLSSVNNERCSSSIWSSPRTSLSVLKSAGVVRMSSYNAVSVLLIRTQRTVVDRTALPASSRRRCFNGAVSSVGAVARAWPLTRPHLPHSAVGLLCWRPCWSRYALNTTNLDDCYVRQTDSTTSRRLTVTVRRRRCICTLSVYRNKQRHWYKL